jgi:hypothetical protein
MRLIAQNLKDDINRDRPGMGYNNIMMQANIEAQQAVDEFNAALETVRTIRVQQEGWLADENKLLAELRRSSL